MKKLNTRVANWFYGFMATVTVMLFDAGEANAAGKKFSDIADGATESLKSAGIVIVLAAAVGGLILVVFGFKNLASENTRVSKGAAIGMIVVGGFMCCVVAFTDILSNSLMGSEAAGLGELGVR